MTMISSRLFQPLILGACALLLASCSSSSSGGSGPTDENSFGQMYKLADGEVQGWSQSKASTAFAVYTDKNLTDRIDGQAPSYVDKGMKFAMYQSLLGPDPQTCTLTVMDFVTEAQAKSMFDSRTAQVSANLPIPSYQASVAMASQNLAGITAFAWFKGVYLEVIVDGFGSDTEAASQAAAKFLAAIEAKTK